MSSKAASIAYIPSDSRITAFPIGRPVFYDLYERMFNCFWSSNIIKLEEDIRHFDGLTPAEKRPLKHTLGFFASSDGLVVDNIQARLMEDLPIYEAQLFLKLQCANEDVHAITYSKLIDAFIALPEEREEIFDAVRRLPSVKRIADFIRETTRSEASLAERILRMITVEGVLFIENFVIIFWFAKRGLMPGLAQSNQLISRDETLHTLFGMEVYKTLLPEAKLPLDKVHAIFEEAIDIGNQFIQEAMPEPLFDTIAGPLNATLMREYAQHQVNIILEKLGLQAMYPEAKNVFPFMEMQNMANQGNFFERKITEYRQADAGMNDDEF